MYQMTCEGTDNPAYDARRRLRADLAQGLRSLDAGYGKELEIEDVIARARRVYATAQCRRSR